jgi:hypothetical protein
MSGFDLNDDDVVSMPSYTAFDAGEMFKFVQLKAAMRNFFQSGHKGESPRLKWLKDGVPCEVLRVHGDGWQKGKLKLCIEFIPDNPEAFQQKPSDAWVGQSSPLDDLRSNLEV